MKKRLFLCIPIILFISMFAYYKMSSKQPEPRKIEPTPSIVENMGSLQTQQHQTQLYQFIANQLSGSHGVYTNYLDSDQAAEFATGHEVLSESAGLMMRYYVLTNQRNAFEEEWGRVKQTFDSLAGFSYRYSPKLDKHFSVNAAVDDLRIIRALYEAGSKFKSTSYTQEADKYAIRFYQHNVNKKNIYDFYDENYKITNSFITLCYVDLGTLKLFPDSIDQVSDTYNHMLDIIHGGYLSDSFPFYETRYQYDKGSYSSENINTVESLLTILHLSEANQQSPESIRFIREHVKKGTLFGQYTKEGNPTNDIQSTAIYAITAMIGAVLDDRELYEDSIHRMSQFQVLDSDTPLDGGFGDVKTLSVYSFDNLMALLAFTY